MQAPDAHPPLTVARSRRVDGATVLTADGDLVVSTAQLLRAALDELPTPRRTVVLDLSHVRYIDSTGLQVLIQATHDARRDGWSFLLGRSLSPAVSEFFDSSGAHSFLPVEAPR